MSMLTFYINRAGINLSKNREAVLEQAKDELRRLHEQDEGTDSEAHRKSSHAQSGGKMQGH